MALLAADYPPRSKPGKAICLFIATVIKALSGFSPLYFLIEMAENPAFNELAFGFKIAALSVSMFTDLISASISGLRCLENIKRLGVYKILLDKDKEKYLRIIGGISNLVTLACNHFSDTFSGQAMLWQLPWDMFLW